MRQQRQAIGEIIQYADRYASALDNKTDEFRSPHRNEKLAQRPAKDLADVLPIVWSLQSLESVPALWPLIFEPVVCDECDAVHASFSAVRQS